MQSAGTDPVKRILVSGMAVIDFVFVVDEMPRRAEKYRAGDQATIGGGGGANAAVAVHRLGGSAVLAARLGDDPIGDMIAAGLREEGLDTTSIRRTKGARSALSSVLVDAEGERQIVNFRGQGLPDDAGWIAQLPGPFAAALTDTRWQAGAQAVLKRAKNDGVPGVLDAEAPVHADLASLASHVAFSEQGLRSFTGIHEREQALAEANRTLPGWVCVTCGAEGVFVMDGGKPTRISAPVVDVVDTLAAGDIWHGAFAIRLAEGANETAAVKFANAAAALKCTSLGGRAATPSRGECDRFLKEYGECN